MIFRDRQHAATLLLERLRNYIHVDLVVLAIPRGAVPMGALLARALGCPLNLVPVRKVASPLAPEFALGAADIEGNFYPEDDVLELPQEQLRLWFKKSLDTIRHRDFRWRQALPRESLKGRHVIVVDDGVATGATMRAALMWARRKQPAQIIAAAPVASREGASVMRRFADHVECLDVPVHFAAVGEFYSHFEEVSDDEVCRILQSMAKIPRMNEITQTD
ncbi:phosphoribosyltransferase [bacterium]|nr:phosphoribosyltransferase [bacterium]